jgi:antitoxin PrlF
MAAEKIERQDVTRGTAKVTSKGQCTIPKSVRDELGIKPGDQLDFYKDKDGLIRVRKLIVGNPLEKWAGYLSDQFGGMSSDELVEEMRGR